MGPLAFSSLTTVVFGMEHLEGSSKQGKHEPELQCSLSTAELREQQLLVPLQHWLSLARAVAQDSGFAKRLDFYQLLKSPWFQVSQAQTSSGFCKLNVGSQKQQAWPR